MPIASSSVLVIFDLDGTVVDAFRDIQAALNHALAAHGLAGHDIQTVRRFVGNGIVKLCERATPPEAHGQLETIVRAAREYYAAHPNDYATLYPGMRQSIGELRARGYRTALLSNKPDALVQSMVVQLDMQGLFDSAAGERAGIALKPDPAAVLALQAQHEAIHTIIVGDGLPDAQAAHSAGAGFIGVTWGVHTREELEPHGEVVEEAKEIPGAVNRLLGVGAPS